MVVISIIDTNVIIEGHVTLGDRVRIGTGCVLKNCVIGDDSEISPYTVLEDSRLDVGCTVGPFAAYDRVLSWLKVHMLATLLKSRKHA